MNEYDEINTDLFLELMTAITSSDLEKVTKIINENVDNELYNQSLSYAAFDGEYEIVELLLKTITEIDIDDFKLAIEYTIMNDKANGLKIFNLLLNDKRMEKHINKNTLLRDASFYSREKIINYLVIDKAIKPTKKTIKYLTTENLQYTLDLIAKRDLQKQLQQEIRLIPETTKKQSKSFKL